MHPDISIILPALSVNEEYLRCLASIKAAFRAPIKFEIICVVRNLSLFDARGFGNVSVIEETQHGIYGAMNTGLRKATGTYIYFIGQDDILLPSISGAVSRAIATQADLVIADVYWGEKKIYRNHPSRNTLLWKNWCHQGLIYDRIKLLEIAGEYSTTFKVQADHYTNIKFSAHPSLRVLKYDNCIAWYSSFGYSTKVIDSEFRRAFPDIIRRFYAIQFYWMVVAKRTVWSLLGKITFDK